jgi:hypothetical protein
MAKRSKVEYPVKIEDYRGWQIMQVDKTTFLAISDGEDAQTQKRRNSDTVRKDVDNDILAKELAAQADAQELPVEDEPIADVEVVVDPATTVDIETGCTVEEMGVDAEEYVAGVDPEHIHKPCADVAHFVAMNLVCGHDLAANDTCYIPPQAFHTLEGAQKYTTPQGGSDAVTRLSNGGAFWLLMPLGEDAVVWAEVTREMFMLVAQLRRDVWAAEHKAAAAVNPAVVDNGKGKGKAKRESKSSDASVSDSKPRKSFPRSDGGILFGLAKGALIRAMGASGMFEIDDARTVVEELGEQLSASCLATDFKAGKSGSTSRGKIAELTAKQIEELNAILEGAPVDEDDAQGEDRTEDTEGEDAPVEEKKPKARKSKTDTATKAAATAPAVQF